MPNINTYRYDLQLEGWWPLEYATSPACIYLEEGEGLTSLLMGGDDGQIHYMGVGTDDNSTPIDCEVVTPSLDDKDTRSQKLYLDSMLDVDADGVTISATPYFNNRVSSISPTSITGSGRDQYQVPLADTSLSLYRNIAIGLTWSSAATPVLFEFQPNALLQPFLALNFSTQFLSHGWVGFGHLRDGWIVYISGAPITLEITCTDGGPLTPVTFTLPSSASAITKHYLVLSVLKGQMFRYNAYSTAPFVLFTDESIINLKEWGSDGPYIPFRPWIGQTPGNLVAS